MSQQTLSGFNVQLASEFNTKAANKYNWYGRIPSKALEAHPGLGQYDALNDRDKAMFAGTVQEVQEALGIDASERDGKLGRGTWFKLLKRYDYVSDNVPHLIFAGRRIPVPHWPRDVELRTWEHAQGMDLHHAGDFTKKPGRKPRLIVLHWGGLNAKGCRNTLINRGFSSHFGVDRGVVYQWLDLEHVSWHAKGVNAFSVGIDICEQPETKWARHYAKHGYDKHGMTNPSSRGPKDILSLDPNTARAGKALLKGLSKVLRVPYEWPVGPEEMGQGPMYDQKLSGDYLRSAQCAGIIAHHHVSTSKWDVAPWMTDLMGA